MIFSARGQKKSGGAHDKAVRNGCCIALEVLPHSLSVKNIAKPAIKLIHCESQIFISWPCRQKDLIMI